MEKFREYARAHAFSSGAPFKLTGACHVGYFCLSALNESLARDKEPCVPRANAFLVGVTYEYLA